MFLDWCSDLEPIINLLKNVIKLLQWGIPMVLILFGMIDLGKAVMAGKEDEMKKAQGTLIKRVIYAIAIFLVITIVTFVVGLVGGPDWKSCWNDAADGKIDMVNTGTGTTNDLDCSDPENNNPACN